MNKYNGLLNRAAAEYQITRGKSEDVNQWKIRIIYSVLGKMALASLYDVQEGEEPSVMHMKHRIEQLAAHYKEMYPELGMLMPTDYEELSDEIYNIYLNSGAIYHKPNRVVMAAQTDTCLNGIRFTRGYAIEVKQMMSGLGTYIKVETTTTTGSFLDMFQLDQQTLADHWTLTVKRANWQTFHSELSIEYLRMVPPFKRGYWVDKPDSRGVVSLLRTGFKGSQLYYLYKMENGKLMVCQLPQWQVENYAYRSLSNACLFQEGVLPPTIYRYDGDLVYLSFGYLPPPAELYLWKLYTWPTSITSLPKDFNRICMRPVFDEIRSVMQQKGYKFIEE